MTEPIEPPVTDQPATPCTGFPDKCPYLLTVPPNPPHHEGGVRCGCNARQDLEDMAVELATGLGVVDPREYKATLDRYAKQVLDGQAQRLQAITEAAGTTTGGGDPRKPAYDAVFAYIRNRPRDFLPATVVDRNAMIWHAVHAALDAMGVPAAEKPKET